MSTTATTYEHIVLDEQGVAWIAGSTMKVAELVLAQTAYGWSAEELHFQYQHLTLGQIYSALAYYWDHKDELDKDTVRRLERVEELRHRVRPTLLHDRLRAKGLR